MKGFLTGLGVVVLSIIIVVLLGITGRACSTVGGVVDRTLDPDNVIYNYEYFKKQYQDIKAMDRKLMQAKDAADMFKKDAGERSKWTFEDKNEHARLSSIYTGLKYQMEDMKADYNAKAKMANRSIFKTEELPDHIE